MLATAACVAAVGLVDVFLVPLSWWRHSQGWFSDQLGLQYKGLSGLPENFVYNEGGGVVFRRLTSTFLSPLATAYLLVVALLFVPLRGRRWGWPLAALLFAALLWTHTRAALLALVLALLVLAVLRRRLFFVGLAVAVAAISASCSCRLRPLRPAHAFHGERARLPGATRARDAGQEQRRDERERGVDQRAPVEPPRRRAHGRCTTRGASASATRA